MKPIEIRWLASERTSCFYAAHALIRRRPVDAAIADALAEPMKNLAEMMRGEDVPGNKFFEHVVPRSAETDNHQDLAEQALVKCLGRGKVSVPQVMLYKNLLIGVRQAFRAVLPRAEQHVRERLDDIRTQWTQHGHAILSGAVEWTTPDLLVENAVVVLVYPVHGAGGWPYVIYNLACLEPAAADPVPELPELFRLAWLLAVQNLDLPKFREDLRPKHVDLVPALAMIPITLKAAEEAQLGHCDDELIKRAIETWLGPDEKANAWATAIEHWWPVYTETRVDWPVALQALDRMLGES